MTRLIGKIQSAGSSVTFGEGTNSTAHLHISLAPGCVLETGKDCSLGALQIEAVAGCVIKIGHGVSFVHSASIFMAEPTELVIGNGCLFASGLQIFTSDFHSILDVRTGARINHAANITIGDEVWTGQNVMILKGSDIGRQTVVGAGSVVSGRLPANCVAVGNPAKVVREGTTWTHALL